MLIIIVNVDRNFYKVDSLYLLSIYRIYKIKYIYIFYSVKLASNITISKNLKEATEK